jgi:glycine/D-amino acid oxidase-like deaminating enzyme
VKAALPTHEHTSGPLPAETDVLVIGGGVAGCALTYYLARAGVETVLVERGELNRESSGTNAGSLHIQIAIHQLAGELRIGSAADRLREATSFSVQAARLWHELEAELEGPIDLHVTGGLMVAETPEQAQLLRDKQPVERAAGLDTEVLEGAELREMAPWLSEAIIAGSYCPLEGHVNPLVTGPLFARRAAERGAAIRTHTEVQAIEPGGEGGSFRVTTGSGTITAARVVNAAGAWAGALGRLAGFEHPLSSMGLHVNVTEPRPRLIKPLVQHIGRRLTLKQAANGTFILGGGWPAVSPQGAGRWPTRWDSAAGNAAVAIDVVPALADVRLVRTWSGLMAWTDDLEPIAGESRRVPGYHALVPAPAGFTLGPILARMLAQQMTGGPGLSELYSPDRGTVVRVPAT